MSSENNAEEINKEIYRATVEPLLNKSADDEEIDLIESYLEKIEGVIKELKSDRIDTAEAIRRLRAIPEEKSE